MTRSEFISNVNSWDELIDFCQSEDCDICSDVYDDEGRDEVVKRRIREYLSSGEDWKTIRDWLADIPDNEYHHILDDYDDWNETYDGDSFFVEHREAVLEWMDDGDYWDEEEPEEVDEAFIDDLPGNDSEDDDDIEPIEEEDFSISELFMASKSQLTKIEDEAAAAKAVAEGELKAEAERMAAMIRAETEKREAEERAEYEELTEDFAKFYADINVVVGGNSAAALAAALEIKNFYD